MCAVRYWELTMDSNIITEEIGTQIKEKPTELGNTNDQSNDNIVYTQMVKWVTLR